MKKLLSGIYLMLLFGFLSQTKAQDLEFRKFTTTTQEIEYEEREIIAADGTRDTIVEVIIKTVVVELQENPVKAESVVEEDTNEETIFVKDVATAEDIKEKIVEAEEEAEETGASTDTIISEVIAAEVSDEDKYIDEDTGEVATEITYVEKNEDGSDKVDESGEIVQATANDDVVLVEIEAVVERIEAEVIVVEVKEIVSEN